MTSITLEQLGYNQEGIKRLRDKQQYWNNQKGKKQIDWSKWIA